MFDELIRKYDQSNLHQVIENLPSQLIKALDFTEPKFNSVPNRIFIFGMGGSALPGNILKTILTNAKPDFNTPLHIIRDYTLPRDFNSTDAAIFISYSGNTEEVLETLDKTLELKHPNIIVITTGGQLQDIAEKNKLPLIIIPNDAQQPRMGYGYFIGALIQLLINSGLIENHRAIIQQAVSQLNENLAKVKEQAQQIAQHLGDHLPIIYTTDRWKYLAMIIKINFNENTKIPSFWNCFPELNHNEMVGFTNSAQHFKFIILRDPAEHPRNLKRLDAFTKMFENKIPSTVIDFPEGTVLYQVFYILWVGLWSSYYSALLRQVDPAPVIMVEDFKRLLNE